MTLVLVGVGVAILIGLGVWDLWRPVRRSREARRLASLGDLPNHRHVWRDKDGQAP